jgi:hypothetical protein
MDLTSILINLVPKFSNPGGCEIGVLPSVLLTSLFEAAWNTDLALNARIVDTRSKSTPHCY